MTPAAASSVPVAWRPHKVQERFLETSAYEALFGGAAGGGKSESLLAAALRHVGREGIVCDCLPGWHRNYKAILFRRTFPELKKSLISRSRAVIPASYADAKYKSTDKVWTFPSSGAEVHFGSLEHEDSVRAYQSAEFQFIGFDEATHFLESQYRYMLTRGRCSVAIPVRIRGGTNPGGPGAPWVFTRFGPWLDPEFPIRALPGQKLWFRPPRSIGDPGEWFTKPTWGALSRVFFPAKLDDNPVLKNDITYRAALQSQDALTRAQLLDGNWLAKAAPGILFRRGWFKIVDAAPVEVLSRWRAWDRAATEPHEANPDPDWTAGLRLSRDFKGQFFVEDLVHLRARPLEIERTILNTAKLDKVTTSIHLFRDPGSAGVKEEEAMLQLLSGFDVHSEPATGDKITRAKPASAQAEAGNIHVVRGHWNERFFQELEQFPSAGSHDDIVDSLSAAFSRVSPVGDLEFALRMSQV